MTPPLPVTLDDLLSRLEDLDACAICTELYAHPDHLATRIPQCEHILEKPCLLEWLKSDHGNGNTCPVCRTKLWNKPEPGDDLGVEETLVSQYRFLQSLWRVLHDRRKTYPTIHQDGVLADDLNEQILDSLHYQDVEWPEPTPLISLQQTAQLMFHAIGFGEGTQFGSPQLPRYTLSRWHRITVNFAVSLSWVELSDAIEEICREDFSPLESEEIARCELLHWFTMRLIQDISTNACDETTWPPHASDQEVKHRVLAIGALILGVPTDQTLSHAIKVARLLHRFHYPGLPPPDRDCGVLEYDELVWLWRSTDELLQTYYNTPPITGPRNFEARLQNQEKRYADMASFFLRCISSIIKQRGSYDYKGPVMLDNSITDEFLMATWKKHSAACDFWSAANLEPQDHNMVYYHHSMTWCSIRVLRLISRVGPQTYLRRKWLSRTESNGQGTSASNNNENAIDGPMIVLLFRAFLLEQEEGEEIDQTLIANAVHEPGDYEFIIWWIVAVLCREPLDAWRDAKGHVEHLIKTWTGSYNQPLADLGIVQRLECVVVYILEHQQAESPLVTGDDDQDEALWIFAEAARQKYASKTHAALAARDEVGLE